MFQPMNEPAPVKPNFTTPEEAAAYDAWFRAKVEASLSDERPPVPHDNVMSEMRAIVAKAKQRSAC
jgi:hypothetical protein